MPHRRCCHCPATGTTSTDVRPAEWHGQSPPVRLVGDARDCRRHAGSIDRARKPGCRAVLRCRIGHRNGGWSWRRGGSDDGPGLPAAAGAIVACRIGPLCPPIGAVGDVADRHRHALCIDGGDGPCPGFRGLSRFRHRRGRTGDDAPHRGGRHGIPAFDRVRRLQGAVRHAQIGDEIADRIGLPDLPSRRRRHDAASLPVTDDIKAMAGTTNSSRPGPALHSVAL